MNYEARQALDEIRRGVQAERYVLLPHFVERMDQRGLVWPDVLAILDDPGEVRFSGRDRYHRPEWIVSGVAADELPVELVCALDVNEQGELIVFITAY